MSARNVPKRTVAAVRPDTIYADVVLALKDGGEIVSFIMRAVDCVESLVGTAAHAAMTACDLRIATG
jgi:molybdopterin-binding protein